MPDGVDTDNLTKKATTSVIGFQIFMGLLLFLPAWTVRFWEAWVYWTLFSVSSALATLHLLKHDPELLERRLKAGPIAEPQRSQKIIQTLAALAWCGLNVVPGVERHFHLSIIPAPLVVVGDMLVGVGFLIMFLALRENKYAASIVEVRPDQRVISTGPYGIVRHPMYSGGVLMILATPLALGSLWALACAGLLCGIIVARLIAEERYLSQNLLGYEEYCRKVSDRLIPHVW